MNVEIGFHPSLNGRDNLCPTITPGFAILSTLFISLIHFLCVIVNIQEVNIRHHVLVNIVTILPTGILFLVLLFWSIIESCTSFGCFHLITMRNFKMVALKHFGWNILSEYSWFSLILHAGLFLFGGRRFTGYVKHTQIGPKVFLFHNLWLKSIRNKLFSIFGRLLGICQKTCELVWKYSAPWFFELMKCSLWEQEWRHILFIFV